MTYTAMAYVLLNVKHFFQDIHLVYILGTVCNVSLVARFSTDFFFLKDTMFGFNETRQVFYAAS